MVFVYDFKATLNRALTAILLASAISSLACANRGMHAPDDGGAGGTAAGGRGGSSAGGRGGGGGTAPGGTGGGPTGVAGTGGTTGAAGNCNVPPDAGASSGAGGACGAMFNFESGVQGATIGTGMAFTMVKQSGAFTFCGSGALAITSMFSGATGSTTKGEILLNLPAAPLDLTGKTITVHVASDPGCSQNLNLSMVLNTQSGPIYFNPDFPILNVTNTWKTGATTVGAVSGSTTALALSLQVTSPNGYQGTIYVDEIDIR